MLSEGDEESQNCGFAGNFKGFLRFYGLEEKPYWGQYWFISGLGAFLSVLF